ncbi:MAG: uncharacterized protein JWQ04_1782 [Pedosphaera sp.]|nr:uncharacterized protein [Pedosphaera sp.]
MGASLTSYAIRGKSPETVLQDFGLQKARDKNRKTRFCGGPLSGGWYLIKYGRHEFTDKEMVRLSQGCEVVACFVEEHVMVSRAAAWKDGREIWSVTHDSQEDLRHLEARGDLPAGFAAIRDDLTRQQEEDAEDEENACDFMFDIPVTLAAEIADYRYDEMREGKFETLEKPSLMQQLFGR